MLLMVECDTVARETYCFNSIILSGYNIIGNSKGIKKNKLIKFKPY